MRQAFYLAFDNGEMVRRRSFVACPELNDERLLETLRPIEMHPGKSQR